MDPIYGSVQSGGWGDREKKIEKLTEPQEPVEK